MKLNRKHWDQNYSTYLYNCSVDSCCVPTINFFDGNKFQKGFEINNFKNLMKRKCSTYFHKDFMKIGLLMESFIFQNKNKKDVKLKLDFLENIDQLKIRYKEKYLKEVVQTMKKKLSIIKRYKAEKKISLLIDLQFIGNAFRYQKFYTKIKNKFYKLNEKKLSYNKGIYILIKKRLNEEVYLN